MTLRGALPTTLTERQSEVLRLLAHGITAKEAAYRMGVSEEAVRHHSKNAYARLGTSGLVSTLWTLGWVCLP